MQVVKYLIAMLLSAVALQAGAQIQQARGQYTVNYKDSLGTFDRKEAPAAVKQKARQEAELKAIEAYYAEAGQSESANFDAIRSKVLQEPGRYILESTVIAEKDEAKDYQYTAAVRVSLNVANLRNAVQAKSAVGQAADSEKSALSFEAERDVILELLEAAPGGWVKVRHRDGQSGFLKTPQVWGL